MAIHDGGALRYAGNIMSVYTRELHCEKDDIRLTAEAGGDTASRHAGSAGRVFFNHAAKS
jgi:hypothetical protein